MKKLLSSGITVNAQNKNYSACHFARKMVEQIRNNNPISQKANGDEDVIKCIQALELIDAPLKTLSPWIPLVSWRHRCVSIIVYHTVFLNGKLTLNALNHWVKASYDFMQLQVHLRHYKPRVHIVLSSSCPVRFQIKYIKLPSKAKFQWSFWTAYHGWLETWSWWTSSLMSPSWGFFALKGRLKFIRGHLAGEILLEFWKWSEVFCHHLSSLAEKRTADLIANIQTEIGPHR